MSGVLVGQEPVDLKAPEPEDLEFYSATTIIGTLDKPGLVYWAANEAAACAERDVEAWQAIKDASGSEEARRWIAGARYRPPKGQRTAADLGTAFHAAAEQYALTGQRPEIDDEVRPFFEQWDRWLQVAQPEYIAAEMTVYSPTYQVAGTCDGIFVLDGVPVIFDLKSSRKSFDNRGKPTRPYPESVALQLACYAHAELAAVWRPRRYERFRRRIYLLSQAEQDQAVAVPKVDVGLAIHVTPEHCDAFKVCVDEDVYDAFLHTYECFRWVNDTSKFVMDDQPLTFAREAAA